MCVFFFFKQKTAYEMRISDWSSDVCSSDLETSAWSRLSKVWTVWYATRRIPRRSARSRNPGSTCSACGQTLDPLRPLAALTMPVAGEYRRPRPSPYRFRPRKHDGLRPYLSPPETTVAAAGARAGQIGRAHV